MGDHLERLELTSARMKIYSLLAEALDYPDDALAASLVEGKFIGELRVAGKGLIEESCLAGASAEIANYAASFPDRDDLLLELQKDYTWNSLASKPRLVPLFESVYREGKLYQESTFEIARLYHEAGLKLSEEFKLPPDHITLELEFMAYLCYSELEAVKGEDRKMEEDALRLQREALGRHLGEFGARFAEKLVAHARIPFYRSVALLLVSFLSREVDNLLPVAG